MKAARALVELTPRPRVASQSKSSRTSAVRINLAPHATSNDSGLVSERPNVAVVIPCHNEETSVGRVIDDFRAQLPDATVYVIDNDSSDATAEIAEAHGAEVLFEVRRGKGFAVDSIFRQVDADVYVMVDGDDTYPASAAREMINLVASRRADMVVGARLADHDQTAFRPLHRFGNRLITRLMCVTFAARLSDILSGYRVFNRRVVQTLPVVSSGFEIETELTAHTLYYNLKIVEVDVPYRARAPGSDSKLRTFRDGLRVLWTLLRLSHAYKPLTFFATVALLLFMAGLAAGAVPVFGLVAGGLLEAHRFALAVLASGIIVVAFLSLLVGIVLHAVNWRFKELHSVLTRGPLSETRQFKPVQ